MFDTRASKIHDVGLTEGGEASLHAGGFVGIGIAKLGRY